MNDSPASHGSRWLRRLGSALFAVSLTISVAMGTARAEGEVALPDAAVTEIHDVISAQLEAFKRDDAQAAFSLASPEIQGQFGSAENFINLVREQYAPVYRSKSADFQPPVQMEGAEGIVQPVVVTGADNVPVLAVYMVQQQSDGAWRIAGCLLYAMTPKGIEV